MRYAITFFLLAGAVLGFGQTALGGSVSGTLTFVVEGDIVTPMMTCPDGYQLVAESAFDIRDTDWECVKRPAPAKPVAPSKQKDETTGNCQVGSLFFEDGGSCVGKDGYGHACKPGEKPPLNPFDEKQLGEWIERNCSVKPRDVCIQPDALKNPNIACLNWETKLELHCMGSKP